MNNQKNYTIAEFVTLPSDGKVYKELIDPQIELRSMTTAEEMRRLAPAENTYEKLCSIIDDCTVKGPQMSSYDMCLGDYQFLLYKLRIVTYGSEYQINTKCPICRTSSTETINLEDLLVRTFDEEVFEKYHELVLPVTQSKVTLKMVTPRMLDEVAASMKTFNRKVNNENLNSSILFSISNIIDTIDGKKPNPITLEEFVRTLPMRDTNMISNYSDKLSNMLGIDTNITIRCGFCGSENKSRLSMTSEFFRPSLDE